MLYGKFINVLLLSLIIQITIKIAQQVACTFTCILVEHLLVSEYQRSTFWISMQLTELWLVSSAW